MGRAAELTDHEIMLVCPEQKICSEIAGSSVFLEGAEDESDDFM